MSITPEQAAALRKPFPRESIGILPKPYKADSPKGKCAQCGGVHGLPAVHLDYVGHAAVTDRLLSVDPGWTWEPLALDEHGLPALDRAGNLWIKLTICGTTRLGVGDGKSAKERIGDCLAEGTMISTARGLIPVESVVVGDSVPTRNGWEPVTDHWLSSPSAPTVAVLLADGRVIQGTPHHRVPTTRGDVRMGALRNGDMMLSWLETDASQEPTRSHGAAGSTAANLSIPTVIGASTSWPPRPPARTSTETSTRPHTDPSPMGSTCTISTTIPSTIASRILQSSRQKHTPATTSPSVSDSRRSAMSAGESSPPAQTARAGVLQPARSAAAERTGWPTSGRRSDAWRKLVSASSAGRSSLRANRGPSIAPVSVVAVLDAGDAPVWNLSVGSTHEFTANGLVVFNSIRNAAMRFGVALDLWSKEELEGVDEHVARPTDAAPQDTSARPRPPAAQPAPTPEPAASDAPAGALTQRTRGRLFALLTEQGITDEAVQRQGMAVILDRPVASRADLTEADARQIIASLEARQ